MIPFLCILYLKEKEHSKITRIFALQNITNKTNTNQIISFEIIILLQNYLKPSDTNSSKDSKSR